MANRIDPGDPVSDPYAATAKPPVPNSLDEATDALAGQPCSGKRSAADLIDHYVSVRRHAIGPFQRHVTDWEHQEYFEAFSVKPHYCSSARHSASTGMSRPRETSPRQRAASRADRPRRLLEAEPGKVTGGVQFEQACSLLA